jgi:hypothetical protein
VGGSYRSSVFGGGGLVLETSFVPGVDLWKCDVKFAGGGTDEVNLPPKPIELFPLGGALTLHVHGGAMRHDWPRKLEAAVRNVQVCLQKLPIFDLLNVRQEWSDFSVHERSLIAAWQAAGDPNAPYNVEAPPQLAAGQHFAAPVPHLQALPPVQPTGHPPYTVDPATHTGYTEAQRRRVQQAKGRLPAAPALSRTGFLLLRLHYRAPVPPSHMLPWCLEMIPAGVGLSTLNADTDIGKA